MDVYLRLILTVASVINAIFLTLTVFRGRNDGNPVLSIGTGMKFRTSELSDGTISLEDWYWYEL